MKIWLTVAPILLFLFLILRGRMMIRLSNKIKRQLKMKDDFLLMTKSSSLKAKQSNDPKIVEELKHYNRTGRNSVLLWLLFILLFVIVTAIFGIASA